MTSHMRGASAEALAAARERIEPLLSGAGSSADAALVGEELFAVSRLLEGSASLRRAATDPNADGESKAALVQQLLGGKVSGPTVDVVAGLARSRWSSGGDLVDACEELGVQATLAGAELTTPRAIVVFNNRFIVDSPLRELNWFMSLWGDCPNSSAEERS
jgi:F-type H+-transporting ATPase subunit delta